MNEAVVAEGDQFLTFKLEGEEFAIEILQVREVLDYTTITKVPKTPDFMRGVINLRGSVVPVVDMRLKFGLEPGDVTVDTCIIIVEVPIDDEVVVIGALADSVSEVMELSADQIEPPPKVGMRLNTEFIKSMGKRDEKFIIMLDIEKIFSAEDLSLVQGNAENTQVAETDLAL